MPPQAIRVLGLGEAAARLHAECGCILQESCFSLSAAFAGKWAVFHARLPQGLGAHTMRRAQAPAREKRLRIDATTPRIGCAYYAPPSLSFIPHTTQQGRPVSGAALLFRGRK